MKAMGELDRERLAKSRAPGVRCGIGYQLSGEELRIAEALERRGLIVRQPCSGGMFHMHCHITPLGRLALRIDAIARAVTV